MCPHHGCIICRDMGLLRPTPISGFPVLTFQCPLRLPPQTKVASSLVTMDTQSMLTVTVLTKPFTRSARTRSPIGAKSRPLTSRSFVKRIAVMILRRRLVKSRFQRVNLEGLKSNLKVSQRNMLRLEKLTLTSRTCIREYRVLSKELRI